MLHGAPPFLRRLMGCALLLPLQMDTFAIRNDDAQTSVVDFSLDQRNILSVVFFMRVNYMEMVIVDTQAPQNVDEALASG